MSDSLEPVKRAALFGAYTSRAFSELALRLLQRSAGEPGFANAFEEIANSILDDLPAARVTGFGDAIEASVYEQAMDRLNIQFKAWLRQVREGEGLVLGWPPVEEVRLDPGDTILT